MICVCAASKYSGAFRHSAGSQERPTGSVRAHEMTTKSCCSSECKTHRQQDKLHKLSFISLSLSLASCSALGKIVSSLVMITMRVSGLWGQKDITRARPHWKRSCLDSTRPGISGQVCNIKTMAYPVLHWPTGQKSKDTKRGHSSFWGLTVGWGCTVGPRGLLNIMQLTGQQSNTADIYTHVS